MANLPIGSIIVWPTDAAVPSGWQVCDGSNGTPPLLGVAVPGAGGSYAVGDTGGSDAFSIPLHGHGLGDTLLDGGSYAEHDHDWVFRLDTTNQTEPSTTGVLTTVAHEGLHPHFASTMVTERDPPLLYDFGNGIPAPVPRQPAPIVTGGGSHPHALGGTYADATVTTRVIKKIPASLALHYIQRLS